MQTDTTIRTLEAADADAVLGIYQQGIDTGQATFQTHAPDWQDWCRSHMRNCRLIAERQNTVLGWAALSDVSSRCVYRGVAEVSIYLAAAARGQGIGRQLLQALITASEHEQIWMLQAGIFPENQASLVLHQRAGFRIVGTRERLGRMSHGPLKNHWRDVVFLERRSTAVGID